MSGEFTPGPWHLCKHLRSVEDDRACSCGYRGVIFGPEPEGYAICQPGHDPAPAGEEGTEPPRYPREIEIANARLIAAAPDLLAALEALLPELDIEIETRQFGGNAEDWAGLERLTNNARAAVAKAKGGAV